MFPCLNAFVRIGLIVVAVLGPLRVRADSFTTVREPDAIVVKNSKGAVVFKYQLSKPTDIPLSVESGCYFHPLLTPKGVVLTDVAPEDHRHHRGVFLAWVEMHGKKDADFWGWGEHAPTRERKIVNALVNFQRTSGKEVLFRVRNHWMAEGEIMVIEDLLVELRRVGKAYVLDLDYSLRATSELTLSQWAFSGFCVRARKDGAASIRNGKGPVHLPAPVHTQPDSDWPASPWYALDMVLNKGTKAGVAVFDHPSNPPALWHNHTGLRMLNPAVTAPGQVTLSPDKPLRLRYRVAAYDGRASVGKLEHLPWDHR